MASHLVAVLSQVFLFKNWHKCLSKVLSCNQQCDVLALTHREPEQETRTEFPLSNSLAHLSLLSTVSLLLTRGS